MPAFGESSKTKNRISRTGHRAGSEYFENDSNKFLQNRCENLMPFDLIFCFSDREIDVSSKYDLITL